MTDVSSAGLAGDATPAQPDPAPVLDPTSADLRDGGLHAWLDSSDLTRELMASPDMVDVLRSLVERALQLEIVDGASVTLRDSSSTHTVTSDDDVVVVDGLQDQLGEGPCVNAALALGRYVIEDLATDPCWPAWGPLVAELGFASLISIQALTEPDVFAAVNLYSRQPRRYTRDDLADAHALAAEVSRVLSRAREAGLVIAAIDPDTEIAQAQAVVMTRYALDADRAFELISRLAQDNDLSLHAAARELLHRR